MAAQASQISLATGRRAFTYGRVFWLPNLLSFSRVLALPFIVLLLVRGSTVHALLLTASAAATDLLDGWLARRLKQVSRFGLVIDPLADKILYDGALLSLAALRLCPVWAAATVLTRDISVLAGVILVGIRRRVIIPPVLIGKLTSCGLALTVLLYVAGVHPFAQVSLYITLGLVIISGINYLIRFWRVLSNHSEAER